MTRYLAVVDPLPIRLIIEAEYKGDAERLLKKALEQARCEFELSDGKVIDLKGRITTCVYVCPPHLLDKEVDICSEKKNDI